jgi:peptidyl-prolyl cis-trans isomerase C
VIRVVPLVAILALCACSKSTPAAAASATPTGKGAATAAPAPSAFAPGGRAGFQVQADPGGAPPQPVPAQLPEVIARVNGEAISKADFEAAVKALEAQAGQQVPAEQRDTVFRGVLDQLVGYRLLIQETKTRKVTVTDAELEARIGQIKQQFPSEEAFKQVLEQRGLTLEKLRSDAGDDLRVTKMLQSELESKIAVTPAQIDDFYKQNPAQFQQGEAVRASHILIAFPENADAAAKQAARAKAEAVLKDVKAGKDFATLAKANSQDPGSAPNGGDLGFFQRGQMVPAFDDAAFKLAPGEVSEIVETNFGYHIIKVAEKQASRTVPLDEVRPQVQQFLEGQSRQAQTQAFVQALKAKGKVEIFI